MENELRRVAAEKELELKSMKARLERILNNAELKKAATADFTYTFQQLGLPLEQADDQRPSLSSGVRAKFKNMIY